MRKRYKKELPEITYEWIAAVLVIAAIIYAMIEGRGGNDINNW